MELGRLGANGRAEVPGRRSIAGLLREAVGSIGPGLIDTSRHASVTADSARGGRAGADSPNLIASDLTDALTLFIARASAMLIHPLSAALQGLPLPNR